MRILIVEDDPLIGMDLQCIVEDCGHEVVSLCDNLAKATGRLGDRLDFAFLDVDLPDGKSFGLAARLRDLAVPFAFVSGSHQGELPDHLRGSRFIPKPYALAAIQNALSAGRTATA